MIFLGRILSWAMIVIGTMITSVNILIAFRIFEVAPDQASAVWTTGEAIDKGSMILFAGLVLGLLTVIADNTRSS